MSVSGGGDIIAPAEVKSPKIRAFHEYWVERTRETTIPNREEFQIENLIAWAGNIMIVDVLDDGADFFHRLVGTKIVDTVGRDLSGKRVSECEYAIGADAMLERYRIMLTLTPPVIRHGSVIWAIDKTWIQFESITVPMSSDGESVNQLLTVIDYLDR